MINLMRPFVKKDLILEEISKVLDSGWLSGGSRIEEFENALKEYNNDKDGNYISVSNATVGLEMALISLNKSRLTIKDEVIVPSWSWVASAMSINNAGGRPRFCDVNKYGVPDVDTIEKHINKNTKAIMIIHQAGIPCDMDEINKLGHKYNIPIIEDAACAFGSEYKGVKIGNSNNIVVFSHQAKKCLTTAGEGGTIVTRDKKLADWFRSYRVFGTNNTPLQREKSKEVLYDNFYMIGTNNKISDIQCAYGLAHLKYINEEIELRSNVAQLYNKEFENVEGIHTNSIIPEYCTRYNWQSYRVLIDRGFHKRNEIIEKLKLKDISSKRDIQSIHTEPVYNEFHIDFHYTRLFSNSGLQLPFYAELKEDEQHYIIKNVKEIISGFKRVF